MMLRVANITDSSSIAKIQVDSYRTAYTIILPSAYLVHFTDVEREADWRDLLALHVSEKFLRRQIGTQLFTAKPVR